MKIACIALLSLALICRCHFSASAQSASQTMDELLKAYNLQGSFCGTALVAKGSKVLLHQGYGIRNSRSGALNDSNSIFQISTLSQEFTIALILRLASDGKLSLKDPLSLYLPNFPGADKITIEDLLTNSSGLADYTNDSLLRDRDWSKPLPKDSLMIIVRSMPYEFAPGTGHVSSNSGYALLGKVIEKLTGKSYFQVVREEIFEPLGMNHSGFDFRQLKSSNKALGVLGLSGRIADSTLLYAAGGIYSTTGDLYKWDRALYSGAFIHDSYLSKAFSGNSANYGYGWVVDTSYGKKVLMDAGNLLDYSSFIARIPADSTCIILLDNAHSQGLPKIAEDLYAILTDRPYEWPQAKSSVDLDSALLRQYTGLYEIGPDFKINIILENGVLKAQPTGQSEVQLFAERSDLFFTKVILSEIEFTRDSEGKVNGMVFIQGGSRIPGKKIK